MLGYLIFLCGTQVKKTLFESIMSNTSIKNT